MIEIDARHLRQAGWDEDPVADCEMVPPVPDVLDFAGRRLTDNHVSGDELVRFSADGRQIELTKLIAEDMESIDLVAGAVEQQLVWIGEVTPGCVRLNGIARGIHFIKSSRCRLPAGAHTHEEYVIPIRLLLGVDRNLARLRLKLAKPAKPASLVEDDDVRRRAAGEIGDSVARRWSAGHIQSQRG